MSETATRSETLTSRAGQILVGRWNVPGDAGITADTPSSLSLTNLAADSIEIEVDGVIAKVPARGTLTFPLDPYRQQVVRFLAPPNVVARGRYVLHDKTFPWMVDGDTSPFPFSGPIDVAVLCHPRSSGPVRILVRGRELDTVEPGEVRLVRLDDEQARGLELSCSGAANGVFCTLAQD